MKVAFEIHGLNEYTSRLRECQPKIVKKILHKAVNAAAQPVLVAARAEVPQRTGALRRQLTKKVKRYSDSVTAIIGPKNQMEGKVKPARYAHLLEFGVKPHGNHPGFAPRKWLQQAAQTTQGRAQQIMSDKICQGINQEC